RAALAHVYWHIGCTTLVLNQCAGSASAGKRSSIMEAKVASEPQFIPAKVEKEEKLNAYREMLTVFGTSLLLSRYLAHRFAISLPAEINVKHFALVALATHRISMTISQDRVTKPLRAPFTEEAPKPDAPGDTIEKPRGRGLVEAV